MKHAINAVSDTEFVPKRLKVDVGGPLLQALAKDLIHKLHDGGLGILSIEDIHLLSL